MEELWKDINITSLPNTPHTIHRPTPPPPPPTSHHFRGVILQDFLSNNNGGVEQGNFSKNPPTVRSSILEFLPPLNDSSGNKNTHEFRFLDHGDSSVDGLLGFGNGGGCDAVACSSVLSRYGDGGGGGGGGFAGGGNRKRFGGCGEEEDETVERRHKRMIKNRESAARSRARKQAYITELELEIAQLSKENAMLRKQHRQLIEAPPSHPHPKKHGLRRTSTAPF